MLVRVQPHNLVAAVIDCLGLSDKRRGVVSGALRLSRSTWRRTYVVLTQPDAHRLNPLREVRASG